MQYRWKMLLERNEKIDTSDGAIYSNIVEEKQGTVKEDQSGYHVVRAILESTKNIGNLIHLEVERVE